MIIIIVKYLFLKKNKFYINKDDNESIQVKILNKFKDIRKPYEKSVCVKDITGNYYKIDKHRIIIRHCTFLLIDDDNHSRIFISENFFYYIYDGEYYGGNFCDDDDNDDDYYDDFCDFCDDYYHDDKLVYYNKPLSDFKRLESAKNNNIVNLINNNYRHKVALLVDDYRIFICEDNRY